MKNPDGKIFIQSGRESYYQVREATVPIKDGAGFTQIPVNVELVINHRILRQLIAKAFHNKSKRSTDGPLIVHITE